MKRRRRIRAGVLERGHGELDDRVGPGIPIQDLARQGFAMHGAVEPIEDGVPGRPDAAAQCRQNGVALAVEQPCRR